MPYSPMLPRKIKEYRDKLGLTQVQFAERFGVDQATVSRAETGRARPDEGFLRKIARDAGVSWEQFAFDVGAHSGAYNSWVPVLLAKAVAQVDMHDPRAIAQAAIERIPFDKPNAGFRYVGVIITDNGVEELGRTGSIAVADTQDRLLSDGSPCLAVVGNTTVLRIYKAEGNVERLEARTTQKGLQTIFAPHYRIVGRCVGTFTRAPKAIP